MAFRLPVVAFVSMWMAPAALQQQLGRPVIEFPQVVDSAVYRSVKDGSKAFDVTRTVNRLITKYGPANFTGGRTMNEAFGEPAPGDWKMLRLVKGNHYWNVWEDDEDNGGENLYSLLNLWDGEEFFGEDVLYNLTNEAMELRVVGRRDFGLGEQMDDSAGATQLMGLGVRASGRMGNSTAASQRLGLGMGGTSAMNATANATADHGDVVGEEDRIRGGDVWVLRRELVDSEDLA